MHTPEVFFKSFGGYPTKDDIMMVTAEIKQTKVRRDELAKKLREMGIEPKE